MLAEDPAQAPEEPSYLTVGVGWRVLGPERFKKFLWLHGGQAADHEAGEQNTLVESGEALIYRTIAHGRDEAAAELNPVSRGTR